MKKQWIKIIFLSFLWTTLYLPAKVHAQSLRSEFSFQLLNRPSGLGIAIGSGIYYRIFSYLEIGISGAGTPFTGGPGALGYSGLTFGGWYPLGDTFLAQGHVLFGGGGASVQDGTQIDSSGSVAFETVLALGWKFSDTVQSSLALSYFVLPAISDTGAFMFRFQVSFLSF